MDWMTEMTVVTVVEGRGRGRRRRGRRNGERWFECVMVAGRWWLVFSLVLVRASVSLTTTKERD